LAAEDVDPLLDIYRRAHPAESPSDLYFRIRTDRTMRYRVLEQAELKLAQADPVYLYSFNWNTPLGEGKLRAFHTADLPLEMRVVLNPEAEGLSQQLASAWASFARSANPNNALLPHWPAYDLTKRATMLFDIPDCGVVNDPDQEAREFLRDRPAKDVL
jgi:para-nitrobenzyl esterase